MADQLLSQADVDALVASLTKNDPPKPAAPAAKPPAPASIPVAAKPSAPAPVPVAAKPAASTMAPRPSAPAAVMMASPVSKPASAPVKPEVSNDMINGLNSKIAELTKQLNNMSAAVKRMEMLEKKVSDLEARNRQTSGSAGVDQKVQQLTDEMKKIVTNLKGTPGYGVRNTFSCEKCDDHGHVAVQFRCTKCGHERWYGWWPEKKK
jgi:hypothetical protein